MKYIIVTGGVLSALGKGVASASIGTLLEAAGLKVSFIKLDPYLNVDPGTMNPFQHGEVYVTEDGAETDLDLGHYERFTSVITSRKNNCTAGAVYYNVIRKERKGEYLGKTVQLVPHVTDEIKQTIRTAADAAEILIVELGGTVGDIESLPFIEALRQLRLEEGKKNTVFIHLTLVPYIKTAGELKTKPTQHSVKQLLQHGIQPDILLCRTDRFLPPEIKKKIALFCNVDADCVITAKDVTNIYEIPLIFHREGLDKKIFELLGITSHNKLDLSNWQKYINSAKNPKDTITIAVVGKYASLTDSYKSLNEALHHAAVNQNLQMNIMLVEAEKVEKDPSVLGGAHGILVPGGFGKRGIDGKIAAARYARENNVPYFGICLGMQVAVIEFARNVCKLHEANSTEFDPQTKEPVICLMTEWYDFRKNSVEKRNINSDKGGTMRLGAYPCTIKKESLAEKVYQQNLIHERHRHRYEFNNTYREIIETHGMIISGTSPDGLLVEIVELKNHPFFIGCQFHPEFKSKPLKPHPLFFKFVEAAYQYKITQKSLSHLQLFPTVAVTGWKVT
ncbi:MAG TPA: CTP synthase [Candidatus Aenigmarchaeota archaeon]|nr:CTP synthase [Candidatus Aenigmarchaeota archaeon]